MMCACRFQSFVINALVCFLLTGGLACESGSEQSQVVMIGKTTILFMEFFFKKEKGKALLSVLYLFPP
jgi:hypothetical protein